MIIGSCEIGKNEKIQKILSKGNECSMQWLFAYTSAIEWMPGTIVDMRIIEKFSKCREAKTETIVKNFKECLHSFNKDWPVGYDENERRVPLKESFELHVRDKSENKSRRATQELLDALNW